MTAESLRMTTIGEMKEQMQGLLSVARGVSEAEGQRDGKHGRPVTCPLDELRPHPSYLRNGLTVSASQLSTFVELGDLAFLDPIIITRDRCIVDGYGRVERARRHGRLTLPCIEYDLTEQEALRYLLHKHLRSNSWNGFIRISLALDLEDGFREKAWSHQCMGGQNKGLSKLAEAERLDVRSKIAAAAGVSTGNVDKVKHLIANAIPELLQALRNGEVSIHQAWKWRKNLPEEQREAWLRYQSERGIRKTIRNLVSHHRSKGFSPASDVSDLIRLLTALQAGKLASVRMISINVPGRIVFVTEELFRTLRPYQEGLALTCFTTNR